jgi:hypothetical protein
MVSKQQYDRCAQECQIWETKFNELYHQFIAKNITEQQSVTNDTDLRR